MRSPWARARRFYGQVLGLVSVPDRLRQGRAEFLAGGHMIVLEPAGRAARSPGVPGRSRFRVEVADFVYEYQRLEVAGVRFVGSLKELRGGRWCVQIADPDGNLLTLVDSVGRRRSASAAPAGAGADRTPPPGSARAGPADRV